MCSWKADRQTDHSDLQQTWPPLHRSAAGSGHPSRSGSPPKSCQSSLPGVKTPPSQSASPSKSNFKFNNLPAATQQICLDFLHFRVFCSRHEHKLGHRFPLNVFLPFSFSQFPVFLKDVTITLSTFYELLQFHSSCLVFRLYRVKRDQILYGGPSPFRASPFTTYQVTNLENETMHGS